MWNSSTFLFSTMLNSLTFLFSTMFNSLTFSLLNMSNVSTFSKLDLAQRSDFSKDVKISRKMEDDDLWSWRRVHYKITAANAHVIIHQGEKGGLFGLGCDSDIDSCPGWEEIKPVLGMYNHAQCSGSKPYFFFWHQLSNSWRSVAGRRNPALHQLSPMIGHLNFVSTWAAVDVDAATKTG